VVDEELEGAEDEREHGRRPASVTFALAYHDPPASPNTNLL